MMHLTETLHDHYAQRFEVSRVIHQEHTGFQDLLIFENPVFGKVLVLDGAIQVTERDNHIYHEMLVHVPIMAHGAARNVLIIGGGDGGTLREAVKHPLERATMVDIDGRVIELSKQFLPDLSAGAFDDPRAEVIVGDGLKYVAETDRRFEVIIIDSTDPAGPGEVLFSQAFYADCKRCLAPGGVLVTQNGAPYLQSSELADSYRSFKALFADPWFYVAAVPTYIGGLLAMGWATDNADLRRQAAADLAKRSQAAGLATRYYDPEVHAAAFALPPEIKALMV